MDQTPISKVINYWNTRPCNVKHSAKLIGTSLYFNEVEQRKYFVEPHIPTFADFKKWRGKKVLELGCGIGTDTINFARCGAIVTAIDISDRSLELAKQRARVFNVQDKIWFLQLNVEKLSNTLPVEPYDLIYAFGVLHHTPDPARALAELHKYVNQNTSIRIMLYNHYSWKNLLIHLGISQHEAQSGCPVAYTYSCKSAKQLLETNGFRVTSIEVNHIFPYKISDYVQYKYKKLWYFRWMPKPLFQWLEHRLGWHICLTAAPL